MDFSYNGGYGFGTDQLASNNIMNFNDNEIFVTQPKINKQLQWPSPTHKYPDPHVSPKSTIPHKQNMEGFNTHDTYPQITENMLIILLLVVLIITCTMIYNSVRQMNETLKLMTSILASTPKV